MSAEKKSMDERLTDIFDNVATKTKRVGIPIATFVIGAIRIMSSY